MRINYKKKSTEMVWSHLSDGFKLISTSSDGQDSARFQEEEGTPKSIMDFNNIKGSGFVGCNMAGSYKSNKRHSDWRNCTAQCASIAQGRIKC